MKNKQTERLLYDRECKGCEHKTMCEWADTSQCCRDITDKLRAELSRIYRKRREVVAKITITTEYVYCKNGLTKTVADEGIFVLQEPYKFGKPFMRGEIQGKCNGGTFKTQYMHWR
jgi:hypothetical protein